MSDTENIQDLINERNNQNKRIEQLVLEIDRLNNIISEFENKGYDIAQERADFLLEIERLNNIINQIEKWCNECIDNHIIARENGDTTISDTFFEIVLNKLKELKENNNDKK